MDEAMQPIAKRSLVKLAAMSDEGFDSMVFTLDGDMEGGE
jgi:hypothetical protein